VPSCVARIFDNSPASTCQFPYIIYRAAIRGCLLSSGWRAPLAVWGRGRQRDKPPAPCPPQKDPAAATRGRRVPGATRKRAGLNWHRRSNPGKVCILSSKRAAVVGTPEASWGRTGCQPTQIFGGKTPHARATPAASAQPDFAHWRARQAPAPLATRAQPHTRSAQIPWSRHDDPAERGHCTQGDNTRPNARPAAASVSALRRGEAGRDWARCINAHRMRKGFLTRNAATPSACGRKRSCAFGGSASELVIGACHSRSPPAGMAVIESKAAVSQ